MGQMKLGEIEDGTVLNECAKFHNFVPYGASGANEAKDANGANDTSCANDVAVLMMLTKLWTLVVLTVLFTAPLPGLSVLCVLY